MLFEKLKQKIEVNKKRKIIKDCGKIDGSGPKQTTHTILQDLGLVDG